MILAGPALPTTARKVALWTDYLELPTQPHAYLAGMLAQHFIESDPDTFAKYVAEAKACAA